MTTKYPFDLGDIVKIKQHLIDSRKPPHSILNILSTDVRTHRVKNKFRVVGLVLLQSLLTPDESIYINITTHDDRYYSINGEPIWECNFDPSWFVTVKPKYEYKIQQQPAVELD
ncbi:MAG: hypothetical protein HY376_02020 [Candidatus Blackburnbacteria bacterium]|nr:hypothetical protein [Candidatus Blackburnbacteria bacterium]